MLRALAVSLAILAVVLGPCASAVHAEENASPAVTAEKATAQDEVRTTQPTPNSSAPTPDLSAASSPDEDAAAEAALLKSVNQSRQQAGVAPLRMEESLRQAALLHGQRMVATQRLEHQLPGEPSLLQRIADVSPLPLDRAGENIANVTCADGAHKILMRSPPHRRNLLDPRFNIAGIAALWSRGRLYVVQDFAHTIPTLTVRQTAKLVGNSIDQTRQESQLPDLTQITVPHLDDAACTLAKQNHPSARLIAASYTNRKIVTYTQGRPEILPPGALRLLSNPNLRQFAVGSCYARNATYPTGIYWVAILLN